MMTFCRLCDVPKTRDRSKVQLRFMTLDTRPQNTNLWIVWVSFFKRIRSGRGPSRMETFANIIVKGLNRWNNLFSNVALYPKLWAIVYFLRRPLCYPVWLRRLYLSLLNKEYRRHYLQIECEPNFLQIRSDLNDLIYVI